jgi:uroporphyrinogen decarboxylase
MGLLKKIEELGRRAIDEIGNQKWTPLERLQRLRAHEEVDRITGGFAFWAPAAVGIDNISVEEYYSDPEKMYYCQLLTLVRFKQDYPLLIVDPYNTEPEALGAKLKFVGDDAPVIVEPALKRKEELPNLQIPEPRRDGRLPYRIEICRMHKEILGKYFPTSTSINAPFSMAVGMRGYEALLLDMREDPDFVHDLLNFCTEVIITFGRAIHNACGSYPSISDAWSSVPHLSPDMFREWSFPYACRCIEALGHTSWSFGGGHQLTGEWKRSLRRILSSGTKTFTVFEPNLSQEEAGPKIDIGEVKGLCQSHKVFLISALHPAMMLQGPVERIEDLMSQRIQSAAPGGGYAFFTSIFPGTPLQHVDAFVTRIKRAQFPIPQGQEVLRS